MSAATYPTRTGIANLPLHISELIHGVAPSYRDPARYSFAHGGKDGIPYPVDRQTYDQSIELLRKAISKAKLGIREKNEAMGRLNRVGRR